MRFAHESVPVELIFRDNNISSALTWQRFTKQRLVAALQKSVMK